MLRCATAGAIRCCSIGFNCASTIELPLNAPIGSVIASGSIRKRMPMVGRLETMVKPMPASRSARTARFAPSVRILSLVSSVPSTSETTSAMRVMAATSSSWRTMSSTMASTGASIDTVIGRSSGCGGSSVLNWLVEQSRRHEMPLAGGEPVRDQLLRAVEKDDADVVASMHEDVAIGALQRRAGDDGVLAGLADAVDLVGDRLQPGPAVFVGERMARAHLGDIGGRMKSVAVLVTPAQPRGEAFGDGALARAGYAHHDQRARRSSHQPRKFSGSAA